MKQVIVVDDTLRLPRGKLAAQVAHAAVAAFLDASEEAGVTWAAEGMPKVVLSCAGLDALLALHERAIQSGIPAALIADAGRTVIPSGTVTCLGLGPAPNAELDALTGTLRLL